MNPTTSAKIPLAFSAALLPLLLLVPTAPAQEIPPEAEEVLCPIFIPEATVKYCIRFDDDDGCVIVVVTTFGVPRDPSVLVKACGLP